MLAAELKKDFELGSGVYLLSHSVGRPLKTMEAALKSSFFVPWQDPDQEPWPAWFKIISEFRSALGILLNTSPENFCPQVNLSSALVKLVSSLECLQAPGAVVLMSEIDFPSMGFALRKALPESCELRFIPKACDVSDASVWEKYLSKDVDLVFVSQAYSNTGQLAPLKEILTFASSLDILTVVDIAQSVGIVPLDLGFTQPDFVLGSSVKWLCGGPGAAYLWIHPKRVSMCRPKDVGWFSHEMPLEFDIHNFRYSESALKFWGGTPSVVPFAIAGNSIKYFSKIGSDVLRKHNQKLLDILIQDFDSELISPREEKLRSGTAVLNFGNKQESILSKLKLEKISVDSRITGIRISPHIYNDEADIERIRRVLKS